jgi:hypothetical protein
MHLKDRRQNEAALSNSGGRRPVFVIWEPQERPAIWEALRFLETKKKSMTQTQHQSQCGQRGAGNPIRQGEQAEQRRQVTGGGQPPKQQNQDPSRRGGSQNSQQDDPKKQVTVSLVSFRISLPFVNSTFMFHFW